MSPLMGKQWRELIEIRLRRNNKGERIMAKKKLLGVAALLILLGMLAGCGFGKAEPEDMPGEKRGEESGDSDLSGVMKSRDSTEPTDKGTTEAGTVEVSTVEELLDAIGPDADIVIKPGYYNLSEYLEDGWGNDVEKWNEAHEYVKLEECYDGVEVMIEGDDGMSIKGGGDDAAAVEIVTEPRYAALFHFTDCHDIKLASLTMGHTDTGDCAGNVINFTDCRNIELRNMDLYGCGVYGIGAYKGTADLSVYDSTVRDCMFGALEIYGCPGSFDFYDSVFTGNGGFSFTEGVREENLSFYRCYFGFRESMFFWYPNDIHTEDCTFDDADSETYPEFEYPDYEYPDYSEEGDDYDPYYTNSEIVPFDDGVVADTSWAGVYAVISENGNSFYLPRRGVDGEGANVSIIINRDKTGVINYYGEEIDFTWYCDSQYSMVIEMDDGTDASASMVAENAGEGDAQLWLQLYIGETAIWMEQRL